MSEAYSEHWIFEACHTYRDSLTHSHAIHSVWRVRVIGPNHTEAVLYLFDSTTEQTVTIQKGSGHYVSYHTASEH